MRFYTLVFLAFAACTPDNTFAGVCRKGDSFEYPVGADVVSKACATTEVITWAHMPLTVYVAPDMITFKSSVEAAMKLWNNGVRPMFVLSTDANSDVTVEIGPMLKSYSGTTKHSYASGHLTAVVDLRDPDDVTSAYWTLAHELGHVVGLCHDGASKSVMYMNMDLQGGLAGESGDLPMFVITNADRDALRQMYR